MQIMAITTLMGDDGGGGGGGAENDDSGVVMTWAFIPYKPIMHIG